MGTASRSRVDSGVSLILTESDRVQLALTESDRVGKCRGAIKGWQVVLVIFFTGCDNGLI